MTTKVSTTDYRANLKHWHDVVVAGEDILVTEHDRVVVRVSAPGPASTLDQLERDGLVRRGRWPRPASADVDPILAPGDSSAAISAARDR